MLGFTRTISNHSIYVPCAPNDCLIVRVYVDDLTIAANRLDSLEHFKNEMSKRYGMKDPGTLHFFLGLWIVGKHLASSSIAQRRHYRPADRPFRHQLFIPSDVRVN